MIFPALSGDESKHAPIRLSNRFTSKESTRSSESVMPVLFFRLCIRFLCLWCDMITGIGRSDSQPSVAPFVSPRTRRRTRDLRRSTRATWPRKTAYRRAFWAWAGRWQVIIYRKHAPDALKNSWCTSFDVSLWLRYSDLESRSCSFFYNLTDF